MDSSYNSGAQNKCSPKKGVKRNYIANSANSYMLKYSFNILISISSNPYWIACESDR